MRYSRPPKKKRPSLEKLASGKIRKVPKFVPGTTGSGGVLAPSPIRSGPPNPYGRTAGRRK